MSDRSRWDDLVRPDDVAGGICQLFAERGHALYDEVVSQSVHAVQAAQFAADDDAPSSLQLAALLHDIGHMLTSDDEWTSEPTADAWHETIAATFLARWFGPEVTEPIRQHVAAKRYLVHAVPDYASELSPASMTSLALQGGPMTTPEAERFLRENGAVEAVRLRIWDDRAKDPERPTPAFADFYDLIAAHCIR